MDVWVLLWNTDMKGYMDTQATNAWYSFFQSRTTTDEYWLNLNKSQLVFFYSVSDQWVSMSVCATYVLLSLSVSLSFQKGNIPFSWLKVSIWFCSISDILICKRKKKEIKKNDWRGSKRNTFPLVHPGQIVRKNCSSLLNESLRLEVENTVLIRNAAHIFILHVNVLVSIDIKFNTYF